jgi:hypothetical protein
MKSSFFLVFLFTIYVGYSQHVKYSVSEIDLTNDNPSGIEELRMVRGGVFVPKGWQSVDSLNYIMIALKDGFKYNEPGAIELEMTNLNPMIQATGKKQHFFNLYASPTGHHFAKEYRDGKFIDLNPCYPFISLRFGEKLYTNENGQGIKVLWRANEKRIEQAPFGARSDWDISKTYVWRMEWDEDSLSVFLNGLLIFGPKDFGNRDKNATMRYIWIGKDAHLQEGVWFGFPGPVYQKIRVFRRI